MRSQQSGETVMTTHFFWLNSQRPITRYFTAGRVIPVGSLGSMLVIIKGVARRLAGRAVRSYACKALGAGPVSAAIPNAGRGCAVMMSMLPQAGRMR